MIFEVQLHSHYTVTEVSSRMQLCIWILTINKSDLLLVLEFYFSSDGFHGGAKGICGGVHQSFCSNLWGKWMSVQSCKANHVGDTLTGHFIRNAILILGRNSIRSYNSLSWCRWFHKMFEMFCEILVHADVIASYNFYRFVICIVMLPVSCST